MPGTPRHSHHFSTGYFTQKKLKHTDLYHAMLTATPQQRSFLKEQVRQSLGHQPSRHWGHRKIPQQLVVQASRQTLEKMKTIEDAPPHVYAERASSDLHASGFFTAAAESVGTGIKAAAKYGMEVASDVAGFVAKNRQIIGTVIQTSSDIAAGISAVGEGLGWWDKETASGLQDFAKGLGDFGKANFSKKEQKKYSPKRVLVCTENELFKY